MPEFHVQYSSNNSGGSWWLKDKDWYALEKAGWRVIWEKDDPNPLFRQSKKETGRWLGALAKYACIDIDAISEYHAEDGAKELWSDAVNQDPDAEGCPTCGPPHYFSVQTKNNCMHAYYYPEEGKNDNKDKET